MKNTLTALLVCGFCAAAGAQAPAPLPVVKVGEVGVYELHQRADNLRREVTSTVTQASTSEIRARIVQPGATPAEIEAVYDAEWNSLLAASGSRFEPPARMLAFPLETGKAWKSSFQVTTASGARSRGDSEVKVLGFEKIATPAGEFDAWKVQARGWINGVSWHGSFAMTQTVWYAPALHRVVRSETREDRRGGNDTVLELKSFRPVP